MRSPRRSLLVLAAAVLIAGTGVAACGYAASPELTPNPGEAQLLVGLRRDAFANCAPIRVGRPGLSVAGIECFPNDGLVERVALYLFDQTPSMLEAYFARLADRGVQPRSGVCDADGGEDPYLPGEDAPAPIEYRQGCYLDDGGLTWIGTMPPFVLAEVRGDPANREELAAWSWKGNQDVPGGPTLWHEGSPLSPEK